MIVLALGLRLAVGVGTYLALPINGYEDKDDRAGFVFTDAHRRDDQAWELARSDAPILSAFNRRFHSDQYGGLLAFTSLAYRYLSPDAHRPLLLVVLSAIIAAIGLPFFWKAANQLFDAKITLISGWILALYPESVLLGSATMREPYLITFSMITLWGFAEWMKEHNRRAWLGLGLGLGGMLLVSPVAALMTLVILAGWLWFASARGKMPWWVAAALLIIFVLGLFLLSSSLNRQGQFDTNSPFGVIAGFMREAIKFDVYQLERGSGWVQKLFDEMPAWMRLPFVTVYGVLQPVLPAVFIEPTTLTWRFIGIGRALGWYAMLPLLAYAFIAAWKSDPPRERRLWLWITVISWFWILMTALRGGGDQWDNPRYRAILLMWQALASGYALACFRSTSDAWLKRILLVELIFLGFFTQWYLSRYFHIGGQLPFGVMVLLIIGSSLIVLAGGAWQDYRRGRA
ncbi:MAG: hypothetical protein Kow002_00260 [Anaerolineales bacterium]